jgi:DNA-binding transcriptional regulator YdaS (Cro superfamily)
MTRDIKPTSEAIWRAVLEYGSKAHLARALGVRPEDLTSWLNGKTEMPMEKYEQMIELVAAHKARRK